MFVSCDHTCLAVEAGVSSATVSYDRTCLAVEAGVSFATVSCDRTCLATQAGVSFATVAVKADIDDGAVVVVDALLGRAAAAVCDVNEVCARTVVEAGIWMAYTWNPASFA